MKHLFALGLLLAPYFVQAQQPIYGQCGGEDWTGGTTCVAGAVCDYQNPDYSQCLPGTASTTQSSITTLSTTPTQSTATSASSPPHTSGSLPFLGGVNTAGFDFGSGTDGSYSGNGGVQPPLSQYPHFSAQGVNIYRIPFAWQLMTPTLGGSLDSNFFSTYDATVQAALSSSNQAYVIVDVHNYARWNGGIIGQGGPSNDQFTSMWSQVAAKYASNSQIIFGVMNEPHDLNSVPDWASTVQLAVNAIRSAGATSQYILMPGSSYSSAAALPTEAGPYLLNVTDPAGGTQKLLFDVHKYLDSDGSGTSPDCVTNNVDVLTTLVSWLQSNGNRQAILSETGGGNTASCETDLFQELQYVKQNSGTIVGYTVWAAGGFAPSYALSVTPNSDGSDQPLWVQAVQPNLP